MAKDKNRIREIKPLDFFTPYKIDKNLFWEEYEIILLKDKIESILSFDEFADKYLCDRKDFKITTDPNGVNNNWLTYTWINFEFQGENYQLHLSSRKKKKGNSQNAQATAMFLYYQTGSNFLCGPLLMGHYDLTSWFSIFCPRTQKTVTFFPGPYRQWEKPDWLVHDSFGSEEWLLSSYSKYIHSEDGLHLKNTIKHLLQLCDGGLANYFHFGNSYEKEMWSQFLKFDDYFIERYMTLRKIALTKVVPYYLCGLVILLCLLR